MVETLKELNDQAIKDGFLLPNGQSWREDYSDNLGKPLGPLQQDCYDLIHQLTSQGPVSIKVLVERFYLPGDGILKENKKATQHLVFVIKEKLGKTAIINRPGWGYLSRRRLIELNVPTRKRAVYR